MSYMTSMTSYFPYRYHSFVLIIKLLSATIIIHDFQGWTCLTPSKKWLTSKSGKVCGGQLHLADAHCHVSWL